MEPILKPRGLPIRKAAEYIGVSRSQFYREFVKPGRVRTVPTGKRDRIVLVDELDAALTAYVAEKRA